MFQSKMPEKNQRRGSPNLISTLISTRKRLNSSATSKSSNAKIIPNKAQQQENGKSPTTTNMSTTNRKCGINLKNRFPSTNSETKPIEQIKYVKDINDFISCHLCKGYLIDATTIIECLHSFCRTCILKYFDDVTNPKFRSCPKCDTQVHKTKPRLNIRSDPTLQDIVYKLIPNLYKYEMSRRREFYHRFPEKAIGLTNEQKGEINGERMILSDDELIQVSIEYFPETSNPYKLVPFKNDNIPTQLPSMNKLRYLLCNARMKVLHLKKFIRNKYELDQAIQVDLFYKHELLNDDYTMMDLAYIYSCKRHVAIPLYYITFASDKSNQNKLPPVTTPKNLISNSCLPSNTKNTNSQLDHLEENIEVDIKKSVEKCKILTQLLLEKKCKSNTESPSPFTPKDSSTPFKVATNTKNSNEQNSNNSNVPKLETLHPFKFLSSSQKMNNRNLLNSQASPVNGLKRPSLSTTNQSATILENYLFKEKRPRLLNPLQSPAKIYLTKVQEPKRTSTVEETTNSSVYNFVDSIQNDVPSLQPPTKKSTPSISDSSNTNQTTSKIKEMPALIPAPSLLENKIIPSQNLPLKNVLLRHVAKKSEQNGDVITKKPEHLKELPSPKSSINESLCDSPPPPLIMVSEMENSEPKTNVNRLSEVDSSDSTIQPKLSVDSKPSLQNNNDSNHLSQEISKKIDDDKDTTNQEIKYTVAKIIDSLQANGIGEKISQVDDSPSKIQSPTKKSNKSFNKESSKILSLSPCTFYSIETEDEPSSNLISSSSNVPAEDEKYHQFKTLLYSQIQNGKNSTSISVDASNAQ